MVLCAASDSDSEVGGNTNPNLESPGTRAKKMKRTYSAAFPYAVNRNRAVIRRRLRRRGFPSSHMPAALRDRGVAPSNSVAYGWTFGVGKERKVADVDAQNAEISTNGNFDLLCAPTPGTGMDNRIGRKICIRSVYLRGFIQSRLADALGSDSVAPTNLVRVILFWDKQPAGAAPAITDLLKESSPVSQLNLNNRDRFVIVKDKNYFIGPITCDNTHSELWAGGNLGYPFKIYKRLKKEVVFNAGSAGTIADINSGALYLFTLGNRNSGLTTAYCTYTSRVRFDDM